MLLSESLAFIFRLFDTCVSVSFVLDREPSSFVATVRTLVVKRFKLTMRKYQERIGIAASCNRIESTYEGQPRASYDTNLHLLSLDVRYRKKTQVVLMKQNKKKQKNEKVTRGKHRFNTSRIES